MSCLPELDSCGQAGLDGQTCEFDEAVLALNPKPIALNRAPEEGQEEGRTIEFRLSETC